MDWTTSFTWDLLISTFSLENMNTNRHVRLETTKRIESILIDEWKKRRGVCINHILSSERFFMKRLLSSVVHLFLQLFIFSRHEKQFRHHWCDVKIRWKCVFSEGATLTFHTGLLISSAGCCDFRQLEPSGSPAATARNTKTQSSWMRNSNTFIHFLFMTLCKTLPALCIKIVTFSFQKWKVPCMMSLLAHRNLTNTNINIFSELYLHLNERLSLIQQTLICSSLINTMRWNPAPLV